MTRPLPPDPYRVVRYVAVGALEGVLGGWVLLGVMLWLDVFGLQSVLERAADRQVAFLMLAAFFAITFSLVGLVWRVMVLLPEEND